MKPFIGMLRHQTNTIRILQKQLKQVRTERDDLARSLTISRTTLRARHATIDDLRRELAEARQDGLIRDIRDAR